MDRNALIAIVLSMVVLIFWSVLFSPSPQQPAPPQQQQAAQEGQVEQQQTGAQQAAATTTVQEAVEPAKAPEAPAPVKKVSRDVVVNTDLYRAVFSENLAALRSFELKDYRQTVQPDSPPLDLNKAHEPNIELSLYRNSVPGLDRAIFEADKFNIDLTNSQDTASVTFTWPSPSGVVFIKTYTFRPGHYDFDVAVTVENRSQAVFDDNLQLSLYGEKFETGSGYYNVLGMVALRDGSLVDKESKKIDKEMVETGTYTWFGYQDNYFLEALVPWEPLKTSLRMDTPQPGITKLTLVNPPLKLDPMQKASINYKSYLGPKKLGILKPLGMELDKAVNFGWFDIIGKPLLWFMNFIYGLVGNYGVAIILLTVLIKILFWPLTQKSYKSMKAMQKLQPQMAKLREKYKDNKEKLNQEMMGLYKTYKVNPFGGCLPMIIQIPVFFALYRVLTNTIAIRHAPFMLWINDLSAPDRLNVGFHIPYTGGFPVLTLLMGASMFIQQKMTPTAGDPTQAKLMLMMPIVFTFMFINFPAGLVLYWLTNNILSIGQQYMINKSK